MQYIPPFVIELGMFCYIIYMTYFILSSIGGNRWCTFVSCWHVCLGRPAGKRQRSPWIFFGGLRGHICRWFPRDWTAGRKSEVFCHSQECNMVPWWCECPCRKLRGVPQIFNICQSYFSDWRLFWREIENYLHGVPKKIVKSASKCQTSSL